MTTVKLPVFLNVLIYIGFVFTLVYIVYSSIFVKSIAANNRVESQEEWTVVPPTVSPQLFRTTLSSNRKSVNGNKVPQTVNTFGELSDWLCLKEQKRPKNPLNHEIKVQPCPDESKGYVTVYPGGRTGNALWEYTSVMALSYLTTLKPYVPDCLRYKVEAVFQNVRIPTLDAIAHCSFNSSPVVDNLEEYISSNNKTSIIVPRYNFLTSLVMPLLNKIKSELPIRKELKAKAQETLRKIVTKTNASLKYTFVGVHVRRTDYVKYLQFKYNATPVSYQYFENAMEYFKSRYTNCLFVYVSDDPSWCYEHFGHLPNVVVPVYKSSSTPEEDLVLLASCNHTISDYGTYGEWAALLAGGETIYSRRKLLPHYYVLHIWLFEIIRHLSHTNCCTVWYQYTTLPYYLEPKCFSAVEISKNLHRFLLTKTKVC